MNTFSPIAVISAGCLLPGASDLESFWKLLSTGSNHFSPLPPSRWPQDTFLDLNFSQPDSTYSAKAAHIEDSFFFDSKIDLPRTHQMLLKALVQCTHNLTQDFFKSSPPAVVLGCMNPGDEVSLSLNKANLPRLIDSFRSYPYKNDQSFEKLKSFCSSLIQGSSLDPRVHYPTSLARLVHEQLGTDGLALCADSACASSLTAIDLSCQLLQLGFTDTVITGGIEGNLGLETYIPFSHLGVLSRENCLPFDSRSDGIVQGEGAVLFVLKRLEDAINYSLPILGVIENVTSSSNGTKASLFSPSFEQQKTIFKQMNAELTDPTVHYVEGHGTGTPVGDSAELLALNEAFSSQSDKVYLGSVKSLIGHTKGAAGAAGLLKSLLIIQHKTIPSSPYFNSFAFEQPLSPISINTEPVSLAHLTSPIKIRINSAGFGGANYHLALSEYHSKRQIKQTLPSKREFVSVVAHSKIGYDVQLAHKKIRFFKIPPHEVNKLDPSQTLGLVALSDALERSLITPEKLKSFRVGVVSASHTRTTKIEALTENIFLKRVQNFLCHSCEEDTTEIRTLRDNLVVWDETSCQSINSMTSGRLAYEYDFHGVNFHVDGDINSQNHGLLVAQNMLNLNRLDFVVVLGIEESIPDGPIFIQRNFINTWILTRTDLASQLQLPILGDINLQVLNS